MRVQKNLGELRHAIEAAIEAFGEQADWYGWDDESVMISDENGYDAGRIEHERTR